METRFQRCPQCGKTYDGPNLLDYHQREAHGPGTPESDPRPGRIFCSTCGLPFDGEGPLSHHKREAHGEILVTSSPSGRGGTVGRVGAAYLAGRGSRLVAAIVDGLVYVVPFFILLFFAPVLGWLYFVAILVFQMYLLSKDGQTIGKKVKSWMAWTGNGRRQTEPWARHVLGGPDWGAQSPCGWRGRPLEHCGCGSKVHDAKLLEATLDAIVVERPHIRIVKVDTGENGGFVTNVLVRTILNGLIGIIPLYGLIDILFIFRGDKRCIHDLIAGTKVVA